MIARQGGDARIVDRDDVLPWAARRTVVRAPRSGVVQHVDAEQIGRASMLLGAGRDRVDAPIDHAAGIVLAVEPGSRVEAGAPLMELHDNHAGQYDEARALAGAAVTLGDEAPPALPLHPRLDSSMTASHGTLRAAAIGLAALLAGLAWALAGAIGPRGQAGLGALCFIAVCAACSTDLRAVRWRTIVWGMAMQLGLALLILRLEIGGVKPGYAFFSAVGDTVKRFLEFSNQGAVFVFGALANPAVLEKGLGAGNGFVFAFTALPTIIFISSFFTILYYFGVLQFIVWVMARAMMYAMRTSGAETLSAAANVFMGQTEAPIIVKPYVPGMTRRSCWR